MGITKSTIPEAEGGARVKVLRKKRIELMGAPCSFGCCSELGGFKSFEIVWQRLITRRDCVGVRGVCQSFRTLRGKN